MTMFKQKKDGDPTKNESNSVFWAHSKHSHNGEMKTYNWEIAIISSHKSPLNRQVTKAMRISKESKSDILNSKNEFGANNLAEMEIQYGSKLASQGTKRKRNKEELPDEPMVPPDQLAELKVDHVSEDFLVTDEGQLLVGPRNSTQLRHELPQEVNRVELPTTTERGPKTPERTETKSPHTDDTEPTLEPALKRPKLWEEDTNATSPQKPPVLHSCRPEETMTGYTI